MHELTLCQNIIKIIEQQANQHKPVIIKKIWLEIGRLAGVDHHAMQFSFPIAARGTISSNAELIIVEIPGQAWCENCHTHVTIDSQFSACPKCCEFSYQITQGQELKVQKMEIC